MIDRALLHEAAAPIPARHFSRQLVIGHQHENHLRHLIRGAHASPWQDGGPVLDDGITLRASRGMEPRGVNEARGDGIDARWGQFQRQGGCQGFHG